MLKVLLLGLLTWFLYNLVFRFIIPIYKTTRQVKQKFREMQNHMQEQVNSQANFSAPPKEKETIKKQQEDYIDFEEIR